MLTVNLSTNIDEGSIFVFIFNLTHLIYGFLHFLNKIFFSTLKNTRAPFGCYCLNLMFNLSNCWVYFERSINHFGVKNPLIFSSYGASVYIFTDRMPQSVEKCQDLQ